MERNSTLLSLLVVILLFLPLISRGAGLQYYPVNISSSGAIDYSSPPSPPLPISDFYSAWNSNYRVDTNFEAYLSGASFNFEGFFSGLYNQFLKELETIQFDGSYASTPITWGKPTYSPGEPIGSGILETVADFVVYQDSNGVVYYKNKSGTIFGNNDKIANEIEGALNSLPSGGGIVYIKSASSQYVVPNRIEIEGSNVILAGGGWGTVIRLADNAPRPSEPSTIFVAGWNGAQKVIVRDLMVDGNKDVNDDTSFRAIWCQEGSNFACINTKVIDARRYALYSTASSRVYFVDDVTIDSGWNNIEPARSSWSAVIGCYVQGHSDVGISTWGSQNLVFANNVVILPRAVGEGYNDANWGIGVEPEGGYPTHNILIKNNVCSYHNATDSPHHPTWDAGEGIWVMDYGLTYNVIIDGNICIENNRWGIRFEYDDLLANAVVCNNNASRNGIAGIDTSGRPGIILRNNVE